MHLKYHVMIDFYRGKRYLTGCWDFIKIDGVIKTVVRQFEDDAIWYEMPMDWEINTKIYSQFQRSNNFEFKKAQRKAQFFFDFINKKTDCYA